MILVTPLSEVETTIAYYRPSHLVTLLSPEHMIETPKGVVPERHLRLALADVAEEWESDTPPVAAHIERLIAFGRDWPAQSPLLVHCWAGISRSTAAAYILLCDRLGAGCEADVARALRYRAPHAYPNPLMIRLADAALERRGRMVESVQAMGRGAITAIGERVELPIILAEL
jgi:predicted protein tyrosine phosphatase